jgi:LPS-assembly protein
MSFFQNRICPAPGFLLSIIPKGLCCLYLLLLTTLPAAVPDGMAAEPSTPPEDSREAWHLSADRVTYNREMDVYTGEGNVRIRKPDIELTADRLRFNNQTMQAVAEGHVRMISRKDRLTGSRVEINLYTEVGTIYDGTLFLQANHFYLRGDRIRKIGKDTYRADRISVTTCTGKIPDWKITGRDLEITIEGYGTLKHAALWARRIPVGYSPFFLFPAKKKRQSGFLTPEFGSSERKGLEYMQPWYWAIDESRDATFYGHYMEQRGFKYGTEYRYMLDKTSRGAIRFDYLDDRKVDDGENHSSSDYGYEDDSVLRPNHDRYWLRMKADQVLPHDLTARLDLDIVSDQDYLHDFKHGYNGYGQTNRYFEKEFGRSLDDYDDSTRLNRFHLHRIWSQSSLYAELRWYDNVIKRRWRDENTTLQQLPLIEFDTARQPFLNSLFYYDLDATYKYYYRADTNSLFMQGHLLDAHPRIFLPFRYQHYLTIEPSVGLRETLWHSRDTDRDIYQAGLDWEDEKAFQHRELYDLRLDISSDLEKIFQPQQMDTIDKIKHRITPRMVYDFTPRRHQDHYPRFESIEEEDSGHITIDDSLSLLDRIEDQNRLTYSITNTFTARTKAAAAVSETVADGNPPPSERRHYRHLARFKIQQSYVFDESDVDDDEPFSDIEAELDLYPTSWLSLETDARWNPYEKGFAAHSAAISLNNAAGNRLYLEHRYSRNYDESETETISTATDAVITIYDADSDTYENAESIRAGLQYVFSERLNGYSEYEHNIEEDETIETRLGLHYRSQCWSLDLSYTDDEDDTAIAFVINLHGLGEIGTQFSKPD